MNSSERVIYKINSFKERFGEGHYFFALHAAFPLIIDIDLLYCIWKNFQRNIHGARISAPWYCVSDLLMSSFVKATSHKYYEMPTEFRNQLMDEMIKRKDLGHERREELSNFLISYSTKNFRREDASAREFMEMQKLVALAYIEPGRAIRVLAQAYKDAYQKDQQEFIRLNSIWKDLERPLSNVDQPIDIEAFKYLSSYRSMVSSIMDASESKIDIPLDNSINVIGIELPTASMLVDKKLRDQAEFDNNYSQKISLLNLQNETNKAKKERSIITDNEDYAKSLGSIEKLNLKEDNTNSTDSNPNIERNQLPNHNTHQIDAERNFSSRDHSPTTSERKSSFERISSTFEKQDILSAEVTLFPKPEKGVVLSPIAAGMVGKVKFNSTSWRARSFLEEKTIKFEVDDIVSVFAREGSCLLVLPSNSSFNNFINQKRSQFGYFRNLFNFSYKSIEDAKHIEFDRPLSGVVQYEISPEIKGRVILENVSWRAKLHKESRKRKLLKGEIVTILGREYNVLLVIGE